MLFFKRQYIIILALAAYFCIIPDSFSQSLTDSVRYMESVWSMKRKDFILRNLDLSEAEKSAFWPIYDSYYEAIQYLEMEYVQLLTDYSKALVRADDFPFINLSSKILHNDLLLARFRKQYFKKFQKVLEPSKAAEFMQLDQTFRTMLLLEFHGNYHGYQSIHRNLFSHYRSPEKG
jgi:hypothetical protein